MVYQNLLGWKSAKVFCLIFAFGIATPHASAQNKVVTEEQQITEVPAKKQGLKRKVAIGRFSNETEYGKGLFYDKDNDPMGKQALDILSTKLAASGKFLLLERNDLAALLEEANRNGESASKAIGADYMIIGSITEFGRKNTSQSKVFTTQKTQTVDAAVSIRLIDVVTGQIIYSEEGKGSAELTTKTTAIGTGSRAGYDASLSDKAISAAIDQLVENIINKLSDKPWRSYFLMYEDGMAYIAGGASQGIESGMTLSVKTKGRKVKNPQTGIEMSLPGKTVGKIKIESVGGDTPETEYAIATIIDGNIDTENITNYVIEER